MTLSKEQQKIYQQTYYKKNKAEYAERSQIRRSVLRKIIIELKHMMPCLDCGIAYPYWIMQYDHRPTEVKVVQIADIHKIGSPTQLLLEIDKCELVCANCHADRTYIRKT